MGHPPSTCAEGNAMYLKKELFELIKTDESIFDFIQEGCLDGLWYWDLENPENEWMNARFWTVLGYNPDEMPHKSSAWQDIINHEDLKVATENFVKHCENPNHLYDQIVRYTHKNGSTVWIRCRGMAIRDKDGKAIRMLGAHQDISDIKNSERHLRSTIDGLSAHITVIDAQGEIILTNKAYRDFAERNGIEPDAISEGANYLAVCDAATGTCSEEAKPFAEGFRDVLAGKRQFFEIEYPCHSPDEKRWFIARITSLTGEGLRQVIVSHENITERKQAEEKFIASEYFFSQIFEQSIVSTQLLSPEGDTLRVNKPFCELFGVTLEAMKQYKILEDDAIKESNAFEPLLDVFHNKKSRRWFNQFDIAHASESSSVKTTRPEKVDLENLSYPVLDNKGNLDYVVIQHYDVTERMQAEKALRKSEALQSKMVANIGDVIVIIDDKGLNRYKSPNIEKLFGWKPEELVGKSTWDKVHPDDLEHGKSFIGSLLEEPSKTGTTELRYKRKDGSYSYINFTGVNLFHDADVKGILGNYHDITERKKAEQELIAAKEKAEESNHLKTAFLHNMSHEIRTPLNGITGFISLLKDPEIDNEEKQHYFDIINKSSDRLIATVTDIIDISRIEAGDVAVSKSEVSVNEILEEQYSFFYHQAKTKGLELIYKPCLSDSEARFVTDKHKLEGILTNLIKNAIKFTEQGEVAFACSLKKEQDIQVLEFYVKDTGIGIPANRISAVFNRFEQADIKDSRGYEGSGLGLAIAKSYVEMLGGEITVSSEVGLGSIFTFSIPYTKQLVKGNDAKGSINEETQAAVSNLSVIIADDDETSIMYFEAIFKKEFKNITYTKTGNETIDKCRDNPETNIILMDIKMPGMTGYDATREIRKFNSDVIIIAQTAFGFSDDREKAIEAGCNDYIAKPIKKDDLGKIIKKYFKN